MMVWSPKDWPALGLEALLLLAALGLAGGLAWLGRRGHLARSERGDAGDSVWFGRWALDGVLFPLLAWLLVLLAYRASPWLGLQPQLLRLALPVLLSLLAIRLVVRVLRLALPQAGWLQPVERWVSWLAWGASILWIAGWWEPLWAELEAISWKMGGSKLTLAALIEASFSVVLVMVGALWLAAAIEARLLRGASFDTLSGRKIVANLVKALLVFVGLLLALTGAGIDLTALGVLGGAIGVGLGFGLQKLAANYVSGFVILAERSLRIGDVVKVDGFEGRITDIKTRFTVVRALNGRESIVPNELLITQRVENSSLADPKIAQTAIVSVAYDSDLERLMPMLRETIASVERVLQYPGPGVQLSNFGADGLELTLIYWIGDPENGTGNVRSAVNLAVLALLRREGVEIPYPQRVVRQLPA
jgi:small-conductance mechanosensitive channel